MTTVHRFSFVFPYRHHLYFADLIRRQTRNVFMIVYWDSWMILRRWMRLMICSCGGIGTFVMSSTFPVLMFFLEAVFFLAMWRTNAQWLKKVPSRGWRRREQKGRKETDWHKNTIFTDTCTLTSDSLVRKSISYSISSGLTFKIELHRDIPNAYYVSDTTIGLVRY